MQHNEAKFSDIHFLHGTVVTTSTTTTITSQPPLSPTTVTTTTTITTTATDESFIFTSSTFNVWGKSRTKTSFLHRQFSPFEGSLVRKLCFHIFNFSDFEGSLAWKLHFHIFLFHFNNSFRKHLSPAMSCACLLLILDEQRAPRKTVFQRAMGQCLAERDYVIFWLSFCYHSGYRLGQLVGSKKPAKKWFWETSLLKILNAVLNKARGCCGKRKAQTPKGIEERAESRAARLFLPQGKPLFFPFSSMARCH